MKLKTTAGITNQIWQIVADDSSSTTGAGLAGLVYNSAGLAAKYKKQGDSSWTTISLATMTGGTYTSGGFVASDSGAGGGYEFCPPNAALSTAGTVWIEIYGATNLAPIRIEVELDSVDYSDATRFGLSALPNAAADAAGGLPVSDAGGLDLDSRLDVAVGSRMASYVQPTGFLAATFPTSVASPTNITAGTITTVTNLTNLPAITSGWITAAGIAANAFDGKGDWSTHNAADVEAAILDEGDATALLAAIAAKVEEFLVNEGDATATIAAIATACNAAVVAGTVGTNVGTLTSRIPGVVQPQTGDSFARLGAPVGASISADVAAIPIDGTLRVDVTSFIGTAITETTAGRFADNQSVFWDNADADTTKTVDDVLTASEVNAEVLDVLSVDTFSELASPPAATSSLKDKLTWLFQWMRNKSTQTSTERKLYADDTTTVISTAAVSDDGTTFTKDEEA